MLCYYKTALDKMKDRNVKRNYDFFTKKEYFDGCYHNKYKNTSENAKEKKDINN